MSLPALSSSGPPELPGLIAASVWIIPWINLPVIALISRPSAEIIPEVMVWSRPNGLPMAKTFCPTSRSSELPIPMGFNMLAGAFICRTARSLSGAAPIRAALHVEPSAIVTWMRLASLITWKFVTMRPLASQTKPDPVPLGISTALREKIPRRRAMDVM